MNMRYLLIPAALIAALAFADTPDAEAHPFGHGARTGVAFGPRTYIGGRVTFPIGHRRTVVRRGGHWERVVSYEPGYYETRTREVEVPGELIGYTRRGRPIHSEPRIVLERYKVWIPGRRIVKRVWVPHRHRVVRRPRGFISVGGRVRIH